MTTRLSRVGSQDTSWLVCSGCREIIYGKHWARNLHVCPECGNHQRLSAHERVDQLFDQDNVELLDLPIRSTDVLGFTDTKPYTTRLADARAATGLEESAVVARGTIQGHCVVATVMDFRFLGGSLGAAVGELITRAADIALERRVPLLLASASGGARMQEGAISLMQMAKTSQAMAQLDEAGLLTLSLITDPTYGGVAASFATLSDVIIAEPGARLGFAGPRVIEQTIHQTLPPGFQTAEFVLDHGHIDTVQPRETLRPTLARLLAVGAQRKAAGLTPASALTRPDEAGIITRDHQQLAETDAWQSVRSARALDRPTTLDYIHGVLGDFQELQGDRLAGDCPAIVGGTAQLDGMPLMVIGHQKGHTISELTARNYGMATPGGYRKAARLMRLAEKLSLPVITLIDTPGAHPGIESEKQGQAAAIAENLRLMASLQVPIITLVTGEGGSGGALALAVADEVLICSRGVYSVISPEGCATILWHDRNMAPTAAAALRVDARMLLRLGVVDSVVSEPDGGSQADHASAYERTRIALAEALGRLSGMDAAARVARRRARFRAFGTAAVTG